MTVDVSTQRGRAVRTSVMTTGPSGLVLGRTATGIVTIRPFRPTPTRIFMAVPEYVRWLIAFRSVALGAHVSVLTENQRGWLALADTIRNCGGTIDLLRDTSMVPGQGRPYRPNLIVDEMAGVGPSHQLGAWQGLVTVANPREARSVTDMRNSDLSIVAPVEGKTAENLRRAYALSANQMRVAAELGESDVVLASMRRVIKAPMPPSPTEYRLLFGG